jgi:uncharacterized protein (TIGR04255 family)
MMPTNNEHIVEVLFAMWFNPQSNEWDSTYFGKYHDKILPLGYTEKVEQKQVELQVNLDINQSAPVVKDNGIRMVFRNPQHKSAIVLADHYISFHKLAPYSTWDELMQMVEESYKLYKDLGIGKDLREVQCLYLNKWELKSGESISRYFNFLPNIAEGNEANVLFQAKYDMPDNINVQLKLNKIPKANGSRDLTFECSTFAKNNLSEDYQILAQKAHDSANDVYLQIINQ